MARRVVRPEGSRSPAQLLDKGGRKARGAESSQTLFQMRKTWQRVKRSGERQDRDMSLRDKLPLWSPGL